jgi:cysteine desulfurase
VPGIVGLGTALSLAASSREEEYERTKRLRDRMLSALTSGLEEVYLNGHPALRLPNNLNLSFTRVDENALMMSMKDVAVSTGSACSSSTPEPSHVLRALGLPLSRLNSAIRFGLGRMTTEEETEYVITRVLTEVRRLRSNARSIHVATAV